MSEEHLKTKIAQYALIIKDRKMLVLHKDSALFWQPPGGRVNTSDNNPIQALKREVKEEIGHEIKNITPFEVSMYPTEIGKRRYVVFFLCELQNYEKKIEISKEHNAYEWLEFDKLMEIVQTNPLLGKPGIDLLNSLRKKGLL